MAILPSGYTQLEYIESTRMQYIQTNIYPSQNTSIELDFSTEEFGSFTLAGSDYSWDGYGFSIGCNFVHFGFEHPTIEGFNDGKRHVVKISANGAIVDEVTKFNFISSTFSIPYGLTIFCNNRRIVQELSAMKFYGCKIKENENIIRNFIPAKQNSSGTIGLYDVIENKFYKNDGNGEFIAGPEIKTNTDNMFVKINNVWQPITGIYIKTNNTW